MANYFKGIKDKEDFLKQLDKCRGDVIVRRAREPFDEYNLMSLISREVGFSQLMVDGGDEFEVYCMNPNDEIHFFNFFTNRRNHSPERIDMILGQIGEVWKKRPDLRLGQLLSGAFPYDPSYTADNRFVEVVRNYVEEL